MLQRFTPKRFGWSEIYRPANAAFLKSPPRTAKNLSQLVYWPANEGSRTGATRNTESEKKASNGRLLGNFEE
jgi:hypothetical protein